MTQQTAQWYNIQISKRGVVKHVLTDSRLGTL